MVITLYSRPYPQNQVNPYTDQKTCSGVLREACFPVTKNWKQRTRLRDPYVVQGQIVIHWLSRIATWACAPKSQRATCNSIQKHIGWATLYADKYVCVDRSSFEKHMVYATSRDVVGILLYSGCETGATEQVLTKARFRVHSSALCLGFGDLYNFIHRVELHHLLFSLSCWNECSAS